jgi:hypothetical protein
VLRDTPTVAADNPRWLAAEFVLSLDQRVNGSSTYDAGDDPQVLAIHTALIDFITTLDDATLEAKTGQRFTDTNDPARDVRIAAASLGAVTSAWLDVAETRVSAGRLGR